MERREEIRDERKTVSGSSAEESFPWAEWAIIEDADDGAESTALSWENIYDGASSNKPTCSIDDEGTSDAEEAQECTDRILEPACDMSRGEAFDRRNEESDGVSVISESDNEEQGSVNDTGSRVVVYTANTRWSKERNTSKEVVTGRAGLLIGCCVLVAIAAGLGSRSIGFDISAGDADPPLPKKESQRLADYAKESGSVSLTAELILEDTRSSALEKIVDATEMIRNEQEHCRKGPHDSCPGSPEILLESTIHEPEATLLERLQNFLRIICVVLKDDVIRTAKIDPSRGVICGDGDPRPFFTDLANLKTLLNGAIEEMGEPIESANRRFLEKIDLRIASMSDSFVSDWIGAMEKLRLRNEKKLEKIARGMRERLCVLRNTLPSDSGIRRSLEANETLLANCNATMSKKFKRRAEKRTEPPVPEGYESMWRRSNRLLNPKRRNSTKLSQRATEHRGSVRKSARKWGSDEQTGPVPNSRENSYSQLPVQNERAVNSEVGRVEQRSKELVTPRVSNKKTEHEERTNRKHNKSSTNERKKKYTKKAIPPEVRSRTVTIKSSDRTINIDQDPRSSPLKSPMQQRTKEWLDGGLNFEMKEDDTRANGHWQFGRSQIRDQLRKDESTDNWYFDRVRSRKNSRLNVNDDIEHQR